MNNLSNYTRNLVIISGLFIVCIILYGCTFDRSGFLKVVPIGILLAISSFSVGGTLGFIFGLPTYNNKKESIAYERNTSLKEIADWLTKIIIGITLVELKSIVIYFTKIVNSISLYLNEGNSGIVISSTILISFFFIGFVSIYLLTITDVFKYLASNDKVIRDIFNGTNLSVDQINVTEYTKEDVELDKSKQYKVLEFVRKNGTNVDNAYTAKRMGKMLYIMKEYANSAEYFKKAYDLDVKDITMKLNEAFIRSKFLKDSKKSNEILNSLIKKHPDNAIPYYNMACNFNREFREIRDKDVNIDYKKELEQGIIHNLRQAFTLDKGLLPESLIDPALEGIEISTIFDEVYSNNAGNQPTNEEE